MNVVVKPGSVTNEIRGVDEWRQCVEIAVCQRAEQGSANRELIDFLSSVLSIPPNHLTIFKGEKTRKKRIMISGLNEKEVALALESEIEKAKTGP